MLRVCSAYTSTHSTATFPESVGLPVYTFVYRKSARILHFFDQKKPDFTNVRHFYTLSTKVGGCLPLERSGSPDAVSGLLALVGRSPRFESPVPAIELATFTTFHVVPRGRKSTLENYSVVHVADM